MQYIKINGASITSMDGMILKVHDRICFGLSSIFLYKNKSKEDEAGMPDTDENPINYDQAVEEVSQIENEDQKR